MMMSEPTGPAGALTMALDAIPPEIAPGQGLFPLLLQAAAQLQTPNQAATILRLLGQAAFYGVDLPPDQLNLPTDHLYHLENSHEWYWFGANLTTTDGTSLGVLVCFEAQRLFGQALQAEVGWKSAQCHLLSTVATVSIAPPGGVSSLVRRSPNVNWGFNGSAAFPTIEDFRIQTGPDSFQGQWPSIFPGTVTVDDGDNLQMSLTFAPAAADPPYFLQGIAGVTPAPKQGLYYSWPQMIVSGSIQTHGGVFEVSGTGWCDHQLMMNPPPATQPSPVQPQPNLLPTAFDGWNWCQFNLANGDAFTGFAGRAGSYSANPPSVYGWYVHMTPTGWMTTFCSSNPTWSLDDFVPVLENALQPTTWQYTPRRRMPGSLRSA